MRIVVDTSALVAILLDESERETFHRILLANQPVMSVVSVVETLMVAQGRLGAPALAEVDGFLSDYRIEIAPVAAADLAELRYGLLTYGKGRAAEPSRLISVICSLTRWPSGLPRLCSTKAPIST